MVRKSHVRPVRSRSGPRSSGGDDAAAGGEGNAERGRTKDIWKGSIAFGLVEIPVALVTAERPQEIKLSYLDRRDFAPIGYKRYNKTTEQEVPWPEIVRGYEHEKGEYVVLTRQDLERASPQLTRTISILQFVDGKEIEPIYYERPYYLEPLKPRSKGYVLLRETLRRTGKVGIAKVAIRTREHIAMVGVRGKSLVLYLLRFANEVRPPSELANVDADLKDAGVQPKEVEIAERLVQDMTGEWRPDEYTDEYATDLMKLVESRVASGRTHLIDESEEKRPPKGRGEALDLMPLLKKSLESARGGNGRRLPGARATRPAARARDRGRARDRSRVRARRGA